MSFYEVKQIYPWLYSFKQGDVYCYLMVGDNRALLYDTDYGVGDLDEVIRTVTDKPYDVVISHGHIDHANGAYQFEKVYLHKNDLDLCRRHCSSAFKERNINDFKNAGFIFSSDFDEEGYIQSGMGNPVEIEAGHIFDLGGLTLETVEMEGHTAGSIGLFCRENKILFNSDAASAHVWIFLKESLPVKKYIEMLERVYKLDFDFFFSGHNDNPTPKTDYLKYIKAARNAAVEKAAPYANHSELNGYLYEEGGAAIVFNERTLA